MPEGESTAPTSKATYWTGHVLSALPSLLLIASAIAKFLKPEGFAANFEKLGYPIHLATPIGIVELLCVVLYVIPRTTLLGAILITGYLGGAIATHVRLGEGWYMPFLFGIVVWLGVYLREPRLRAIVPVRS